MADENRPKASPPVAARAPAGLAAKVVKDPSAGADAMLLSGFVGDSAVDGHTRLYQDVEFDSFIDIPTDSLIHVEEPAANSPTLTPSLVWVRRDATLVRGSFRKPPDQPNDSTADAGSPDPTGGGTMGATIPPFCGGFPTIPPHCLPPTLPSQCLPHTFPPHCLPPTLPPQCLPHTFPPLCHPTLPPQCLPHTFPPLCQIGRAHV